MSLEIATREEKAQSSREHTALRQGLKRYRGERLQISAEDKGQTP
jgi:hypothetical protein